MWKCQLRICCLQSKVMPILRVAKLNKWVSWILLVNMHCIGGIIICCINIITIPHWYQGQGYTHIIFLSWRLPAREGNNSWPEKKCKGMQTTESVLTTTIEQFDFYPERTSQLVMDRVGTSNQTIRYPKSAEKWI